MNPAALWIGGPPLVLASTSLIRRALAESAGLPVEATPPGIDERAIEAGLAGLPPSGVAAALATEKALAVSRAMPGRYVLGADQTLEVGHRIMHKPGTRQQAADQLGELSGRAHCLRAALTLAINGHGVWSHVETATLTARPYAAAFIHAYLDAAGDKVLHSVGGYQIEALGMHLFERIEGDHSVIMGLPLLPLLAALRNLGLVHA